MIEIEEVERIINAGLIGTRPTDEGLKIGLALCAENKKLRELVAVQKEYIRLFKPDSTVGMDGTMWVIKEQELRTKIAGLEEEMG